MSLLKEACRSYSLEEQMEIEQARADDAEFASQLDRQIQHVQSLIASGEVSASSALNDEEMLVMLVEMSPEELQHYAAQRNEELEQILKLEGIQAALVNSALAAAASVRITQLRVPNR